MEWTGLGRRISLVVTKNIQILNRVKIMTYSYVNVYT